MAFIVIMSYILVIILIVSAFGFYDIYKKKKFVWMYAKNIPVLPFLPFVGSMYLFIKVIRYPSQIYKKAKQMVNSDYFILFNWFMPMYMTTNPDDLKVILPNVLERGLVTYVLGDIIDKCLLNNTETLWRINRKIMNKSFKQRSLNAKISSINEAVNEYLTTLSNREQALELAQKNKLFFIKEFIELYFPYFHAHDKNMFHIMYEYIKVCNDVSYGRAIRPWLYIKFLFNMTKMKKNIDQLHEKTNQMTAKIINSLKETVEQELIDENTDDVIINLEKAGVDLDDIITEIKFLLGAATDSQGFVLIMIMIALGLYPEIQEKVYNEVLTVVGASDFIDQHHLQQLKYTEMVIKETLRLFPAVPLIPRKTKNIVDLGNDKILPKDMEILISVYDLHRDEKYWKDPLEFNPDRFLPEESETRHPLAFIPFSIGTRNCIGYKYAMISLVVTVALLVRKYKIGCLFASKSILDVKVQQFISLNLVDKNITCTFTPRLPNCQTE